MIKVHSSWLSQRWFHLTAAGLCLALIAHLWLDQDAPTAGTLASQSEASRALLDSRGAQNAASTATPGSTATAPPADDHHEEASTALETGMEDWQKPENKALHAELQRWYDHREETSVEQRRADASALMAQVEARQAAGKLSETSAALAKLMLLQGAPSDDPQHAARLQEVMALLAGRLSFGE